MTVRIVKNFPELHVHAMKGCDPYFALAAAVIHQGLKDYENAARANDRIEMDLLSKWLIGANAFRRVIKIPADVMAEKLTGIAEAELC